MKLATKHLFPFIRMINKLDIKTQIKEFYFSAVKVTGKTEEEKSKLQDELGIDFVFALLEKLPNAEEEVFHFLSLYAGVPVDDIKESEIDTVVNLFMQLMRDPSFTRFFRQAVK